MPAITKDRAIEILREALQNVQNVADRSEGIAGWHRNGDVAGWHEVLPEVGDALAATEHITDTAATQAAEKPLDGLVNPPSRAEPASQHCASTAPVRYENRLIAPGGHQGRWVECEPEIFERFMRCPDAGDGFKYEVRALCVAQPVPRAGRNAQPDSTTDLAPTDLSAVEVPPLPESDWVLAGSANNRDAYTADQMNDRYREGYAAGRAAALPISVIAEAFCIAKADPLAWDDPELENDRAAFCASMKGNA